MASNQLNTLASNFNLTPSVIDQQFDNPRYLDATKEFLESNSLVAKLAFLIFVIFLFIVLLNLGINILAYLFSTSPNPIIINGMVNGENMLIKTQNPNLKDSIPILRSKNQRDGLEFTWSTWLYVKNPPLNSKSKHYRHVFNKGNVNLNDEGIVTPNNAPGLYISPEYRELKIIMNTFKSTNEEIVIGDIPLNKWMNVIIRVDQRKLDVFINGTMTRSKILSGVPKQNYDNINIALNGGFLGNLSLLQYFSYAIGTNEIQNIIEKGPNLTSLDNKHSHDIPYYLSLRWFFPKENSIPI